MNPAVGIAAFAAVSLATAVIGFYGLRISRTTGDFYVASRTVRPWWNASAIGGEYLSAASFLGVAGLILLSGTDALWFPVGYTAGYLMLLLFVAAPLRRSGAYTIPDFTEARLDSRVVRSVTSVVVVMVGWLYIVPQLHGAALAIRITTGLPAWVGMVAVVAVVCVTVVAGGMRSITFVQAFQYWLKLTALAVPILFIVFVLAGLRNSRRGGGVREPDGRGPGRDVPEHLPAGGAAVRDAGAAARAGALLHEPGRAVGPPDHPDCPGPAVGLLPVPDGVRADRPDVRPASWRRAGRPMRWCCCSPGELVGGMAGDLLSALVVAGAFAAFLSTTSGLVVSLAGVISQDLFGGSVQGFRRAAVISAVVPLGIASMTGSLALAGSVGMVFAFTASTICPVLLLGIWWRGLTDAGAIAGMVTGAVLCGGAMVAGAVLGAGGTAVLAGAARGLDGAGGVCRDGPGLPGHPGPRAADHHPAHDPAAHSGTAAGHRALRQPLSRWRP